MIPVLGVIGMAFTVNVYVATASAHGDFRGLLVVTVIITVLPISCTAGAYVNEKGDELAVDGLTVPEPFSVIVTFVAEPPKILPLTIMGVPPQMFPLVLLKVTVGELMHPHDTEKLFPDELHPDEFLTVIAWVPFATALKTVLVW
jgi:hypothetical protein